MWCQIEIIKNGTNPGCRIHPVWLVYNLEIPGILAARYVVFNRNMKFIREGYALKK
jgi:hypothetical protein